MTAPANLPQESRHKFNLGFFSSLLCSLLGQGIDAVTLAAAQLHSLLQPAQVDALCAQERTTGGLVAGLIARRRVSVLIGDSGLGKSPFAYELGLCVAAGIPFLGMATEPGVVVYADYENGLEGSRDLRDRLCRFLGLPQAPENFLLWTPDQGDSLNLEEICRDVKPALVILDSLRSHDPHFEKSENAGEAMKNLGASAYKNGVALLAIHHIRKPGPDGVPLLDSEGTNLMHWLNQASGHRAIINQSYTRIAADLPDRRAHPDAAMVLRWHTRIQGETGPIYLDRMFDENGDPIGYRQLTGAELLSPERRAALEELPSEFTFGQAKMALARSDDPTAKFISICKQLGLVEKIGRGRYRKCRAPEGRPGQRVE